MDLKIYKKSAGVFTDISAVKDYYSAGTTVAITDTDYLYIATPFKFNSLYVKFTTPNTVATVMSIQLWSGTKWEDVAYLDDGTNGFTKNGQITFMPDQYLSWNNDDSSRVDSAMPIIYLQYYIRIKFSVSLLATTKIAYLGHLFLDSDLPLVSEYPILAKSSLKVAYTTAKTDWEEQRYVATQLTIEELIKKNTILSPNQLLDISRLKMATISKTAQIIFSGMGDDYIEQASAAAKEFHSRLNNILLYVDQKNTAIVDNTVRGTRQGVLSR